MSKFILKIQGIKTVEKEFEAETKQEAETQLYNQLAQIGLPYADECFEDMVWDSIAVLSNTESPADPKDQPEDQPLPLRKPTLVKVYSKTNCPKCEALKEYLNTAEVKYESELVSENDLVTLQNLRDKVTEGSGFPVAEFSDGTFIGGDVEKIMNKLAD